MAIKANIVIDQGADYLTEFNLTDVADEIIDLTGYTGRGQMRKYYTSSSAYDFNVNITPATGKVSIGLTSNTTNQIVSGRYVYDVELVSNTGIVSRIVEGIVTVTPGVTRDA